MDADAIRLKLAAALEAAVERAETNYAEWGKDDCVLWCANVLRDGAGIDPVPTIRGKYDSLAGAHKMIGKQGLAAGMRYRARKFGWKRVDPKKAQIGDLAVFKDEATGAQSCVLKYRGRFYIARGWAGISLIPEDRIALAWSVI